MDIFQRAVNFLDRAQDRMSTATNQAAHLVSGAAHIRTLEARQVELRQQIDQATLELGRLTFGRWKSRGSGNEQAMAALCTHIDTLNTEYQQLIGALNATRVAPQPAPQSFRTPTGSYPSPQLTVPPAPYVPAVTPSVVPLPLLASAQLPPPVPAHSSLPSRECPECYSIVQGGTGFCPSCGMRI